MDIGCGYTQGFAQGNDVATFGHRNTQRHHLLALKADLHQGWVHIAALNLGDIAQLDLLAGGASDRHGLQLLNRLELPLNTDLHHVQRRLHGASTFHRVLLPELRQHRVQVQAQLGQALLRNFNIDFFVLGTKQLDFVNIGHAKQLLTHVVGDVTDFGHGKTLGLDGINHAIDIAKIIVEEWPDHALWQGLSHVADFFAYRVPNVGDISGFRGVFDLKNDLRLTRLGVAANLVGKRRLLQGAL